MGYEDEYEILDWLREYGYEDDANIEFYEKGYGFYRDLMEYLDEELIVKLGKYLKYNRYWDLRDINHKDVKKLVKDKFPEQYANGHNYFFCLRDDIYKFLKGAHKPVMIGGGQYECLKEIELLLQIYNVDYDLNYEFIY
jgi:hypothetical protein